MSSTTLHIMGYRPHQLDDMVDEMIDHMDEEGNVDNNWIFERTVQQSAPFLRDLMGPDYMHQMKRSLVKFIGNEDYFGQPIHPHPEVDSYCSMISCHRSKYDLCDHMQGIERIKILYELQRFDDAIAGIKELPKSKKTDGSVYLARIYLAQEQYHDALDLVENLLKMRDEDGFLHFQCLCIKMNAFMEINPQGAIELTDQMRDLMPSLELEGKETEILEWTAYMYLTLGRFILEQERYQEAGQQFANAYNMYFNTGSKFGMAKSLQQMALVLVHEERIDQAQKIIAGAEELFREINVEIGLASSHLVTVAIHMYNQDFGLAEDLLVDAIQTFEKSPMSNKKQLMGAYSVFAQIAILNGKFAQGQEMGLKAVEIAREMPSSKHLFLTLTNMMVFYMQAQKHEEAEKYLEITLKRLEDTLSPEEMEIYGSELEELRLKFKEMSFQGNTLAKQDSQTPKPRETLHPPSVPSLQVSQQNEIKFGEYPRLELPFVLYHRGNDREENFTQFWAKAYNSHPYSFYLHCSKCGERVIVEIDSVETMEKKRVKFRNSLILFGVLSLLSIFVLKWWTIGLVAVLVFIVFKILPHSGSITTANSSQIRKHHELRDRRFTNLEPK